jgi:flagellar biosynthesis anti-sigma factor FlgM
MMSSKINGLNGASPAVDAGNGTRRAPESAGGQASGSAAASAVAGSDVHITDSASLLAGLAQHLSSLPAVDSAQVAKFQAAIDNGSYKVQPGVIATNLMQFEHSLAQLSGG